MRLIDEIAKEIATRKFALPPCLHIPIAARDEEALQAYIGTITEVLVDGRPTKAVTIRPYTSPKKNSRLPIWALKEAVVLHCERQVWVHVDYANYRRAYQKAFRDEDLTGLVLDHVLNRRVARLKGFSYLRIVPISRGANSSSGGLSEKWQYDFHRTPEMMRRNKERLTFIQYADLADIVKMLDRKTGGSLQDAVNEAQRLVQEEPRR